MSIKGGDRALYRLIDKIGAVVDGYSCETVAAAAGAFLMTATVEMADNAEMAEALLDVTFEELKRTAEAHFRDEKGRRQH